jgi:hypothetical protein
MLWTGACAQSVPTAVIATHHAQGRSVPVSVGSIISCSGACLSAIIIKPMPWSSRQHLCMLPWHVPQTPVFHNTRDTATYSPHHKMMQPGSRGTLQEATAELEGPRSQHIFSSRSSSVGAGCCAGFVANPRARSRLCCRRCGENMHRLPWPRGWGCLRSSRSRGLREALLPEDGGCC